MKSSRIIFLFLLILMFLPPACPSPARAEGALPAAESAPAETVPAADTAPIPGAAPEAEAAPADTVPPEETPRMPDTAPEAETAPTDTASAGEAFPEPGETPEEPEETPEPVPTVIDRITNPEQAPDFAFSPEDDLLEIWFPPIRDQDCAIFLYQDQVWLLDCGDERAATDIVPLMKHLGIRQVDKLINTHPHHDHLNGLYSIDAEISVRELLICFPEDSSVHITAAMEYCKGNRIPVTSYSDETVLTMGDGLVSFLCWQKSDESESVNDRSAQFMVTYGLRSILFTADMETRGQRQLYDALGPEPLAADILRYPHHGKKALLEDFYAAVHPALVVITNAPRIAELAQSTDFLDNKHVPVAYTRQSGGVIHLVTDGDRWLCELVPFDVSPYLTTGS